MQKHFPGLLRAGFQGQISVTDPALGTLPKVAGLRMEKQPSPPPGVTHVVITAPWPAREQIFRELPASATDVLLEKPFAVSGTQFELFRSLLGATRVTVIHNYRLKPNVLAFRRFLLKRPSGSLRWVNLHYETPSPALERSAWMREEWKNRILLTDYAFHYLDLAWALFAGPMTIGRCHVTRNDRRELRELSADVSFPQGGAALFIRQGAHQRQCIINFVFDNYTAQLRFFPDSFQPLVGGHGALDDWRLFAGGAVATGQKVLEKLGWKTFDRSHDQLLGAFTGMTGSETLKEFSLEALAPFYERLTQLADRVYSDGPSSNERPCARKV
jgi:predicted dehydrogenase